MKPQSTGERGRLMRGGQCSFTTERTQFTETGPSLKPVCVSSVVLIRDVRTNTAFLPAVELIAIKIQDRSASLVRAASAEHGTASPSLLSSGRRGIELFQSGASLARGAARPEPCRAGVGDPARRTHVHPEPPRRDAHACGCRLTG